MAEESNSLEFTPTWVVAIVLFSVASISLCAEHGFHRLGKIPWLDQYRLMFKALEKLKERTLVLLLGFLLLQYAIRRICIPSHLASHMLPCKKETVSPTDTASKHCSKGKVPLLSQEALQDLQVFILVLAMVHVIFCVTTMVLGGARINQSKNWEDSARDKSRSEKVARKDSHIRHHVVFITERAIGYWRKSAVVSWLISFFKQFYNSISKSNYIAFRQGFIMAHCPGHTDFNFHEFMMRAVEHDFRKVVGISWYLWLFVVIFLLLNLEGWHTYFWLAFLPLILLLLVGAKLEHIITRLAQDVDQNKILVHPSDEYYWFCRPGIVLDLIHFILFQNSLEIAFFIWIWCIYGFRSCIIEKLGYIIPRLIIRFDMFTEFAEPSLHVWADDTRNKMEEFNASGTQMQMMTKESYEHVPVAEEMVVIEATTSSITELPFVVERPLPSP